MWTVTGGGKTWKAGVGGWGSFPHCQCAQLALTEKWHPYLVGQLTESAELCT